jgi:hypothetical protein
MWVPSWSLKPHGLPVPKKRRLRLKDSPWDKEKLRLTPLLTRGQPRKWPLARQTLNSEPPIWGQIKKLMDMAMMITGSLGMAGNPTATLLVAFVIMTIQVGVVQGDAYWNFMPNLPIVHPITWSSLPVNGRSMDSVKWLMIVSD